MHRDLKPRNILLAADGRVFVTDFGLARLAASETTLVPRGTQAGTPAYMAPEQVEGAGDRIGPWTDVWSMGATLYAILAGRPPFGDGGQVQTALAVTRDEPRRLGEILPDVDPALEAFVMRCLSKDPRERPPDGRAFEAEVGALLGTSVRSSGPQAGPRAAGASRESVARWRLVLVAGCITALSVLAAWVVARSRVSVDSTLDDARRYMRGGAYERAEEILRAALAEEPDDPDLLVLNVLATWWSGDPIGPAVERALGSRIGSAQRSLVQGIHLIDERREREAITYLEGAVARSAGRPEPLYALGEALWHSDRTVEGVAVLERAFASDPGWPAVLHHVTDHHLAAGRSSDLRRLAAVLRPVDRAAALAVEADALVGEGRYDAAARRVDQAIHARPDSPDLLVRLAQARLLQGDVDAAERVARRAFRRWPLDNRERGGFSVFTEVSLYRGDVAGYLGALGERRSRLRDLVVALWRIERAADAAPLQRTGVRPPPFAVIAYVEWARARGRDTSRLCASWPAAEVRLFCEGLDAEDRGAIDVARDAYRTVLGVPSDGELRMLAAHHLARVARTAGDHRGAASACDEVLHPRLYRPYRAVVLPDCLLWTGDVRGSEFHRRLVHGWWGPFTHPAVARAREALAASGLPGD